jgi:hypothetical protein
MNLSPWEAASRSDTQEISNILGNLLFQYRVNKSPPLNHILSQTNPIHTTASYFSKIQFIIVSPKWSRLLLSFPPKSHMHFYFFLMLTACPANRIFFKLICLVSLGEEHKFRGYWLCSPLPPSILLLFCPNNLPRPLFSNIFSLSKWEVKLPLCLTY